MKYIPIALTQKVGRQILIMKKNSPRTLFVVGIAGTVVSTVLACRATLKLEETLDDIKDTVDNVKDHKTVQQDWEYRRGMAYVYTKGTADLVKLYAPAIIVGGVSIAALTGSHITLTRRNAGLTAAYSAVAASFEAYRERVRKEFGEEKEKDLYHGSYLEKQTIDGKLKDVKVLDPNGLSMYARIFDESNPEWKKNAELNRVFIQAQQNYFNQVLRARGHVFLNEIYESLGFERSSAGQVVGWLIGEKGDNFIDFGMFETPSARFVNGVERSIVLDFNVDGVIYDKI